MPRRRTWGKERDSGVQVENNPCPPKNQGDGEGPYLAHLHVSKNPNDSCSASDVSRLPKENLGLIYTTKIHSTLG